MVTGGDLDDIRRLEESLWREETRFDRAHMEKVLAADFIEYGRSGGVYSRQECMAATPRAISARLPLSDFAVRVLDHDTVLVTYLSEVGDGDAERANRSSIWSRTKAGWRLRFHQGTPRA
jgi:hypothetical protein